MQRMHFFLRLNKVEHKQQQLSNTMTAYVHVIGTMYHAVHCHNQPRKVTAGWRVLWTQAYFHPCLSFLYS